MHGKVKPKSVKKISRFRAFAALFTAPELMQRSNFSSECILGVWGLFFVTVYYVPGCLNLSPEKGEGSA